MRSFWKLIIFTNLFVFCGTSLVAQLSLRNSNWNAFGSETELSLEFGEQKLKVKSSSNMNERVFDFKQQGYYLAVFGQAADAWCGTDLGTYRIEYETSGQKLRLKIVQDTCESRARLLDRDILFTYDHNDRGAARNWFQNDPDSDLIAGIGLERAYRLLKGRKAQVTVVAVIDNGVDIDHEDLKNVIWTNQKEIPGNGVDDDKNGYVDDIHGWNFRGAKDGTTVENEQYESTRIYSTWRSKYDNAEIDYLTSREKKEFAIYNKAKTEYLGKIKGIKEPNDIEFAYNLDYNSSKLIGDNPLDLKEHSYGTPSMKLSPNLSHGTHVAGIIAAERNNKKGVDGIADSVAIMPILATTATGDERDKDVANAIRYAVNNGARVINMSFSKPFSLNKTVVDDAVMFAERRNVLIVHAAGNDGENIDLPENYHYPTGIYENGRRASNFITVGWSRSKFDGRLAHPYSDYGVKNVDIFAPGSDIFSTVPGNSYDFKSASSMSTPMVSGVASLLLSYFPRLSTSEVRQIILKSAFRPSTRVNKPGTKNEVPFRDLSVTGGIVNAYAAVRLALARERSH